MRFTKALQCASEIARKKAARYHVAESTIKASNLPESYIKRAMEQVEWRTPKGIQYARKTIKKERFLFTMNRPWTQEFYEDNPPGSQAPLVPKVPVIDWPFFKGDRVQILEGDDKGKQGIINYIVEERNWVVVEGLNLKYEIIGKTRDYPGLCKATEQPLLVNEEVALVDPSDLNPTEVEWVYTEEGERVRISKRTSRVIPIPLMASHTYDYKTKESYIERQKDTKEPEVTKVTYVPQLSTFQMDIMQSAGIKDDRIPQKTWWYYVDP